MMLFFCRRDAWRNLDCRADSPSRGDGWARSVLLPGVEVGEEP